MHCLLPCRPHWWVPEQAGAEQLACKGDCRLSRPVPDLINKVVQEAQVDIHLHVLTGGILR